MSETSLSSLTRLSRRMSQSYLRILGDYLNQYVYECLTEIILSYHNSHLERVLEIDFPGPELLANTAYNNQVVVAHRKLVSVVDLTTQKILNFSDPTEKTVMCIKVINNHILIATNSDILYVWDYVNSVYTHALTYTGVIVGMEVIHTKLVTAHRTSHEGCLRVWDDTFQLINTVNTEPIFGLTQVDNAVVVGMERQLCVVDVTTLSVVRTLPYHGSADLFGLYTEVVVADLNKLCIVNILSGDTREMNTSHMIFAVCKGYDGRIFTGHHNHVRVWDPDTGDNYMLVRCKSPITSLVCNHDRLIIGSKDKILVWA